MPDIAQIIAAGAHNPWFYLPVAVLLGALHALEPGHAKSVMAAFLIAVRGTPGQALVLGICAAIGHTLVVWGLVLLGLWLGSELIEKQAYPWLVLLSGVLIVALSLRLFLMMRGGFGRQESVAHDHEHDHHDPAPFPCGHDHSHHDHSHHNHGHGEHDHGSCGHSHMSEQDIAARYAGRPIPMWEVAWFGFTGGLLPCPSAIAVLLVALQVKAYALGVAMVAAFSLGLAATLVGVGLVAVWGARKLSGVGAVSRFSRHLPLVSCAIVLVMGLVVTAHGITLIRAL